MRFVSRWWTPPRYSHVIRSAASAPDTARAARSPVHELQRLGGNAAVARLLGGAGAPQAKLRVGAPGDAFERDADRAADVVLRTPEPAVQRSCGGCAGGTPCAECAEHDEDLAIRRAPAVGAGAGTVSTGVVGNLGAGRPLDAGVRGYFEPRFGHRFGDVRVHTGPRAEAAAGAVAARAFTLRSDIVFGAGEYAPHTSEGRRLLAHELAHVVQQRSADEPVIQRELVWAGGYPRRYATDTAEVACVRPNRRCEWFPASIDFAATAERSGGGVGKRTFRELLDHIASRPKGSITELGLIGHASSNYFGLSGRIEANDVLFTEPGLIGKESLQNEQETIAKLRDRFAPGAKIILYGCHAGAGQGLLDLISQAFQVCVQGFSREILTCVEWSTTRTGRARTLTHTITSRGKVFVDEAGLVAAGLMGCGEFRTSVRELAPDRESCTGVPQPTTAPTKAAALPGVRRLDVGVGAGAALSGAGWRAAADLGLRYSLGSHRLLVFHPVLGAHLLYLSPGADREPHVAAAIVELGLRAGGPVRGVYADVRAGAYAGLEIPASGSGADLQAVGGLTAALGGGYRWERVSIGAEARGLAGAGPDQFVVLGVGRLAW